MKNWLDILDLDIEKTVVVILISYQTVNCLLFSVFTCKRMVLLSYKLSRFQNNHLFVIALRLTHHVNYFLCLVSHAFIWSNNLNLHLHFYVVWSFQEITSKELKDVATSHKIILSRYAPVTIIYQTKSWKWIKVISPILPHQVCFPKFDHL